MLDYQGLAWAYRPTFLVFLLFSIGRSYLLLGNHQRLVMNWLAATTCRFYRNGVCVFGKLYIVKLIRFKVLFMVCVLQKAFLLKMPFVRAAIAPEIKSSES